MGAIKGVPESFMSRKLESSLAKCSPSQFYASLAFCIEYSEVQVVKVNLANHIYGV